MYELGEAAVKFGAATPSCVVPLGWTQPVCGPAGMQRRGRLCYSRR